MSTDEKIKLLTAFKGALRKHDENYDLKLREWLNQNVGAVRREVIEAKCLKLLTIGPPPAVGGLILRNVDPFDHMFDRPYLTSMTPIICDMIDQTIGVLRNPTPRQVTKKATLESTIQAGYAFIAMPIDKDDHQLIDVLEALKEAAAKCGITAERVDEVESSERITDRILESISKAEFVIVDLTNEKPNVFFEAGYAHGIGKIPIYIARAGTTIHFDVKDYPVIMFRNLKELKEGIIKRLQALSERKG